MIESLPLSQMLRVRCIVVREEKVEYALENMVNKFLQRGYPRPLIENHKLRVKKLNGSESFRPKNKKSQNRIPFISTYSDWSEKIGMVINKYWFII